MEQNQAETNAVNDTDAEHKCDITLIKTSYAQALPEVITKEIEHVLHLAAHILKEGGEVPMLFVGMDAEGHGHLIDPDGIPVKPMVTMLVRRQMVEMKAVACLMISEGWTVPDEVAKAWVAEGRPEGMKIQDHPEAYEVLMLQAETLNGTWCARAPVSPVTGEGQERTVGELVFEKATAVHGDMQNFLPQNLPEGHTENPMLAFLLSMMGGSFVSESMTDDTEGEGDEAKKDDDAPRIVVIPVSL